MTASKITITNTVLVTRTARFELHTPQIWKSGL